MTKKKKNINYGKIKAENVKIGDENHYHNYDKKKSLVEKIYSPWVVGIILLIDLALGLWGELMPSDFQTQLEEATNGHYTLAWVGIGIFLILSLLMLTFWKKEPSPIESPTSLSEEMRSELIKNLKQSYSERLRQKLDNRLEINLEYKYTLEGIEKIKDLYFNEDIKTESDAGTKLAKIYNKHNHLVILGLPGSGKTSRLLDLSLKLLNQAEKDSDIAIPIIINLAPWSNESDFNDWVKQAIIHLYGYPKRLVQHSILNKEIVLFLDGLDEVGSALETDDKKNELRINCIEAIRIFLAKSNIEKMVLCSRIDEYQQAVSQNADWADELSAQILVKPISEKKVIQVLSKEATNESPNRAEARKLLRFMETNRALKQVITTPFYFNAILVILEDAKSNELAFPSISEELMLYITETYISIKLSENTKKYPLEKSEKYLAWLASFLKKKGSVTFELIDFGSHYLIDSVLYLRLFLALYVITVSIVAFFLFGGLGFFVFGVLFGLLLLSSFDKPRHSSIFAIFTYESTKLDFVKLKKRSTWKEILWSPSIFSNLAFSFILFLSALVANYYFSVGNVMYQIIIVAMSVFLIIEWLKNASSTLINIFHFSHVRKPYARLISDINKRLFSYFWLIPSYSIVVIFLDAESMYVAILKISTLVIFSGFFQASIFKFMTLNFLLKLEKSLPFPMAPFFKHCTSINILEQDGGTWRFRHQILQDYFYEEHLKSQEKNKTQKPTSTPSKNK